MFFQLHANGDRIDGLPEDVINPLQRGKEGRQQYMVAKDQESPEGFQLPHMFPIRVLLPEAQHDHLGCSSASDSDSDTDSNSNSHSNNSSDADSDSDADADADADAISKYSLFGDQDGTNMANPLFAAQSNNNIGIIRTPLSYSATEQNNNKNNNNKKKNKKKITTTQQTSPST